MGDIALIQAVQIDAPDVERIAAQCVRDVIEDGFDHHHALRPTEAAERGVGHGMCLAAVGNDLDVLQIISIVEVKHRAVIDRAREVCGVPAARGQHHREGEKAALVIEARLAVGDEVMTFAGDEHVGVAIQAQLHGSAGFARQHGRGGGDQGGLTFLAAESAAHTPALDDDVVGRNGQRMGHDVLHFGRMLGRAVDQHRAVFLRYRGRNLSFQVEVVLATHHDGRTQAPRSQLELPARIAALHSLTGDHVALGGERGTNVEQCRQRRDLRRSASGGLACRAHRGRGDGE